MVDPSLETSKQLLGDEANDDSDRDREKPEEDTDQPLDAIQLFGIKGSATKLDNNDLEDDHDEEDDDKVGVPMDT